LIEQIGVAKETIDKFDDHVLLGLSHGDLKFEHIVPSDDGLKFIDWETLGLRSMMFDVINLLATWYVRRAKYHHLFGHDLMEIFVNLNKERNIRFAAEEIKKQFHLYTNLFVLERYVRVVANKSISFNKEAGLLRAINFIDQFTLVRKYYV